MTLEERNTVLTSTSFIARIRVAFCDWIEYWAINGTSSIENENLRQQTERVVRSAIENLDIYTNKIAVLAISDANIVAANELTDELIRNAVTNIMSNALEYIL